MWHKTLSAPGNPVNTSFLQPDDKTTNHFAEPANDALIPKPWNILSLLDHLIKSKEMDLYYYLLNKVAVLNFTAEILEISSTENDKTYNIRIQNILTSLIGKKVKVIASDSQDNTSLKSSIIENFKKDERWINLEKEFPGCAILDIVHKNG